MNTSRPFSTHPMSRSARLRRLLEQSLAPLERLLNGLFALTQVAGRRRRRAIWIIFFIVWFGVAWLSNPTGWQSQLQSVFSYLLKSSTATQSTLNPILALLWFIILSLTSAQVVMRMLAFCAPFFLARQLVAAYLQDIFELDNISVARRFIDQAALASKYKTLHIRHGEVDKDERNSPLYKIGGPGFVQVELDSVALFEKPDSTPRVIGPTLNEQRNRETLEGFERLREVLDLRDIVIDPLSASGRSRDGIPVNARDVRLVYSVQRGKSRTTLERPHPFVEEAVRSLVYQRIAMVTPEQPTPGDKDSKQPQSHSRWSLAMPALIHGELSAFIGEHNLSEFLVNIGDPEISALRSGEDDLKHASSKITDTPKIEPPSLPLPTASPFTPRTRITNLFYDFASGVPGRAENRGLQLEWIGVGTWQTPAADSPIFKHHVEAWKISRENYQRGHPEELGKLHAEARLQELLKLVQTVPLEIFQRLIAENAPPETIINALLLEYREKFKAARDVYRRKGLSTPKNLQEAIGVLNAIMAHFI